MFHGKRLYIRNLPQFASVMYRRKIDTHNFITMSNAETTDFPKLFQDTYWGGQHQVDITIIANRNKFAGDYGLVSCPTELPLYILEHRDHLRCNWSRWCDHLEEYKDCNGNWVLISSPLRPVDHTQVPDGWHLIDNLYSDRTVHSCTICKVVAPRQRVRACEAQAEN